MAQYQSFPDANGASRTLDKLKALKLPVLSDRSFLDIGCNEGFFCGFAQHLGATRVVGVDRSALFIERARARFPACEFVQTDWDRLPAGSFDVILLASALHYAHDQAALIARLVERLSDDGTLVLEMGIASAPGSEWVQVDRGIDTRAFPTMKKLHEVLEGYAWKWMGRSVAQAGDPVPRHVVHVSRRRPVAYLLMQPPGYGKSSLASRLFPAADIPLVSGDQSIAAIANGSVRVADRLREVVARDYSPFRIDVVVRRVFEEGAGAALVGVWAGMAGDGDFALDMFVPTEYQAQVDDAFVALGYLPVRLQWDRLGPPLLSEDTLAAEADTFYGSLQAPDLPRLGESGGPMVARGFVDELQVEAGKLFVRGWAVDETGSLPDALVLRVNGQDHPIDSFERQARPDVQRHLRLDHSQVGYCVRLHVPGLRTVADIESDFALFVPGGASVRLTARVQDTLSGTVPRT